VLKSRTGKAFAYFIVMILGALSTMAPHYVEGAEYRIKPNITLGEEYNDNIFLTPQDRSADFISQVAPSLDILYKGPLWDWDVRAYYEYRYYVRFHDDIKQSNIPSLNLINHTRITAESIFLDIREKYSKESLNLTRDYTQESAFINQTDKNVLTLNPYFIIRPTSQMTVTTGYTYSNIWYKDPTAIDQVDNTVYTGFQQDLSERSIMTVGIIHDQNKNKIQDFTRDDAYLGYRYEYIDSSTLSVKVGNSWFNDKTNAVRITQVFWDAILTHRYSTMTVTYETGLRFIPDPYVILRREDRYLATVKKEVERTSLVVSGGLIEYRNIRNKHLESSDYRVNGKLSHAISTTSKIILDLSADWYWDYLAYSKTQRYLTGVRFEHLVAENLTLALEYRYTNSYSPDVYSDNYFNNRFSVELKTVF
jgi:hypothetical protein